MNGGASAVFARRLREPVVRHFEAAQHAFRNFDLAGAIEHLARVQALAPNLAARTEWDRQGPPAAGGYRPRFSSPTRRRGLAAAWSRRGGARSLEQAR